MSRITREEINSLKYELYTVVEPSDLPHGIISRAASDTWRSPGYPDWVMCELYSHLFNTAARFSKVANNRGRDLNFLDVPLSELDKAAFKHALTDSDILYAELPVLLEEGYRCTLSRNHIRKATCATLIAPSVGVNKGKAISGFAADWSTALLLVLFKHHHILKGDWREIPTQGDDDVLA